MDRSRQPGPTHRTPGPGSPSVKAPWKQPWPRLACAARRRARSRSAAGATPSEYHSRACRRGGEGCPRDSQLKYWRGHKPPGCRTAATIRDAFAFYGDVRHDTVAGVVGSTDQPISRQLRCGLGPCFLGSRRSPAAQPQVSGHLCGSIQCSALADLAHQAQDAFFFRASMRSCSVRPLTLPSGQKPLPRTPFHAGQRDLNRARMTPTCSEPRRAGRVR